MTAFIGLWPSLPARAGLRGGTPQNVIYVGRPAQAGSPHAQAAAASPGVFVLPMFKVTENGNGPSA